MGGNLMLELKKAFTLTKSELGKKFRVENNNLDLGDLIESTGFQVARLGDIAPAHRGNRSLRVTADVEYKYVQIGDIDIQLGRIASYARVTGGTAPNNAKRIIQYGDILVSTRRPTRGACVSVPKELDGELCTIFFTTLRVNDPSVADPRYVAIFLRTSLARYQFHSMITETAYPVVSDEDVESLQVLLPDIDVQRRVADEYERSVARYFSLINEANSSIVQSKQGVETLLLGEHAEQLHAPIAGLIAEQEEKVDEEE
jgi:type I restriction enzyme S subunit